MMGDPERPVEELIDALKSDNTRATVTLGELLDRFEDRTLGVVLVVFGLITALPVIGAIPGVPALAAAVILLAVVHAFFGRRGHFWAPAFIRGRTFRQEMIEKVVDAIRPYGRWMDQLVVNLRLSFLVDTWAARVFILLASVALAVLMVFLAPLPFGVLPVSFACICLGLALVGRDGLFALAGHVLLGLCVVLLVALWNTIFGG